MPEVQPIQVINIDNVPFAVDAMSETAQRLVAIYNEWNQKEADIRNELMIIQAAKETLSRQIIEQVRNEKAEAEKAEAEKTESAEAPIAPTTTEPVPVSEPVPIPEVNLVGTDPVTPPPTPTVPTTSETETEPTTPTIQ
jgi:hypothetical protein